MTQITAFPDRGVVLFDGRDDGRTLRYRWHPEVGIGVLSLWRGERCVGTFQLSRDDLPRLVQSLVGSLAAEAASEPASDHATA